MGDAACAPFRRYKYNLSSCWWMFVGHAFPFPQFSFFAANWRGAERNATKSLFWVPWIQVNDSQQSSCSVEYGSTKCPQIDILTKYFVYWHLHMPRLERTSAWREPSGLLFFRSGCKVLQEHGRCTGQRSANIGATQGIAMTFRKWNYYKL